MNGNKDIYITYGKYPFKFNSVFKRKICYIQMTNLLQITINARKSHLQSQRILQLVYEDRALFVWLDLHVSSYKQQNPKGERAIVSFIDVSFYTSLFIEHHHHPQKKGGGTEGLEI